MSQPNYPLFSKRLQREKKESQEPQSKRNRRAGYNFGRAKEYDLAEKWFQERQGTTPEGSGNAVSFGEGTTPELPVEQQGATPELPVEQVKTKPVKSRGPPPGLVKPDIQTVWCPAPPILVAPTVKEDCDLDLTIPSYEDFEYCEPPEMGEFVVQYAYLSELEEQTDPYEYIGQLAEYEIRESMMESEELYNKFLADYNVHQMSLHLSNTEQAY